MKHVKAVIGTNAWGGKAYGKLLRGSYVEDAVIQEADAGSGCTRSDGL